MSSNPLRLRRLFDKYVRNVCSPSELQELWSLIQEYSDSNLLDEDMLIFWNHEVVEDPAEKVDASRLFREMIEKEKELDYRLKHWKQGRKRFWHKWAAAAIIMILLSTGSYLWYRYIRTPASKLALATIAHDVQAPQGNHAVITLANGQLVYLDSSENGTLTRQGPVKVVKLDDGKLTYSKGNDKQASESKEIIRYNTLTNPKGSRVVDITLSDGSRIWLNAGSSLTYPVVFSGDERGVVLTGEAYFEVVNNSSKPFRVKAGSELIEVLGTKFNIRAYTDDPELQTTLLEGAVKVTLLDRKVSEQSDEKAVLLKPGEQAWVELLPSGKQQIRIKHDVNVDDAIAWKEGRFRFTSVDIATIMREVARWYDVDVIYKGTVSGTLSGGISRTVNICGLLHVLELTGKVSFTVEGKKVIVHPVDPK